MKRTIVTALLAAAFAFGGVALTTPASMPCCGIANPATNQPAED